MVTLHPREWQFAEVPPQQLVVGCIWEYARESASIRNAVELAKTALASQGIAKPESPEREAFRAAVNEAFRLLHLTGFNLDNFWVKLPFPEPWLSVDKDERAKWADFRPAMPVAAKIPAFQVTGDYFVVSHLYGLAHEANEKRKAAWAEVVKTEKQKKELVNAALRGERVDVAELNKLDGRIAELLAQAKQRENPSPVSFMGAGGVQFFVAQINWREDTKREIKIAFNQWVEDNPPTTIPEPSKRGKHTELDWKRKLRDLGIMRLMHESGFGNMKYQQPDAWKFYHWTERYWYRNAERAVDHFHTLLPHLPEGESPIHVFPKPEQQNPPTDSK